MELTKSSGAYVGAKKRNKAVAFPGERNREKPLISPLEKRRRRRKHFVQKQEEEERKPSAKES